MLSNTSLPKSFWGYALQTAVYLINRIPSKSIPKTPFELWTGHKPSLRHIRIWGCRAHVKKAKVDKLESRTELFLFVGYPKETKGGYFYRSLTSVKMWLTKQFQMKDLGEASYVLGIRIFRDRKNKMLALSQASYIDKILEKYVFTLNGGAIVWRSVKKSCVSDSTMEAEYVAASEAVKEVVWLRNFLRDLEVIPNLEQLMVVYCNNSGAVANISYCSNTCLISITGYVGITYKRFGN
ncbi:hypothetical protein UlMin_037643 [Ulmus minor]